MKKCLFLGACLLSSFLTAQSQELPFLMVQSKELPQEEEAEEAKLYTQRFQILQPRGFQTLLKKNQTRVYLIDVQEAHEFAVRHIRGAINVPLSSLSVSLAEKYSDKPILLYSRSDSRAQQAYRHYFSKTKATIIYRLQGGLHAWHKDIEPKLQRIQGFTTPQY